MRLVSIALSLSICEAQRSKYECQENFYEEFLHNILIEIYRNKYTFQFSAQKIECIFCKMEAANVDMYSESIATRDDVINDSTKLHNYRNQVLSLSFANEKYHDCGNEVWDPSSCGFIGLSAEERDILESAMDNVHEKPSNNFQIMKSCGWKQIWADILDKSGDIRINDLFSYFNCMSDITTLHELLLSFCNENVGIIRQESLELLLDYFLPTLDEAKNQDVFNYDNYIVLNLIVAMAKTFPRDNCIFSQLIIKILTKLLNRMRFEEGESLVNSFRCFVELYMEMDESVKPDVFDGFVAEFMITFGTTHALFTQAYNLLRNYTIHGFDEIHFLKLLIKIKPRLSIKIFELIDLLISTCNTIDNPLFIVVYLFQIAVSNRIWNSVATNLLLKHINLLLNYPHIESWARNFTKKAFQWMQICRKANRYKSRLAIIANTMKKISKCASDNHRRDINIFASTLILDKSFPELELYFDTGPFDQCFLDEIDEMEIEGNLIEQLCSTQNNNTKSRASKLVEKMKRNILQENNPFNHMKIINQMENNFFTTINFFYVMLSLILTIIVLLVVS